MKRKFTHYVSALLVTLGFVGSATLILGLLIIGAQKIGEHHPMVIGGIILGIIIGAVIWMGAVFTLEWMDDRRHDKMIRSMVKIKDNKYDRK